jgi:hypothetical protein
MGRARLWPRRDAEAPGREAHTKPCQPDKEAAIPPHHTCRRPRMLWQAVGVMPGFWGGGRWGNARMGRPTQKTCSTTGPLCIIHSLFLYVRAEIPLSLPVPITQHTPGPAVVQWLVIHTGAVGEREQSTARVRRHSRCRASARCIWPGQVCLETPAGVPSHRAAYAHLPRFYQLAHQARWSARR